MYNGMSYNDIFVEMNGILVGIYWYIDIDYIRLNLKLQMDLKINLLPMICC